MGMGMRKRCQNSHRRVMSKFWKKMMDMRMLAGEEEAGEGMKKEEEEEEGA